MEFFPEIYEQFDQDLAVLVISTLHFVGVLAGITILVVIFTPAFYCQALSLVLFTTLPPCST
jgi:hypothetical protein